MATGPQLLAPGMMTPEQRYMLDTFGFLHIEGALSPDELREAQEAASRYVHLATNDPTQLPPGFGQGGDARTPWAGDDARRFVHGFAFDKALERLAVHPAIWPIVLELTGGRPQCAPWPLPPLPTPLTDSLTASRAHAQAGGWHAASRRPPRLGPAHPQRRPLAPPRRR